MVAVSIENKILRLEVKGLHKLWSFKCALEIPLTAIEDVRKDPQLARGPGLALRFPGTHIPWVIAAGTFYKGGKRMFWDVHKPENAVVITLKSGRHDVMTYSDDRYDEVVVEVADPAETVQKIKAALGPESGSA